MNYLLALSIFLAVLSVANKILLAFNKRSGWTSGIVIGLASAVYFYLIGLRILSVAELGFFLVMLYGYITHVSPSKQKTLAINIIISSLSVLLCLFLFAGYLTVIETISSISFIWGGYLLTTPRRWLGWVLFIIAHVSTSIVSFHAQQTIFASLQIVSALVCICAIFMRQRRSERHSFHKAERIPGMPTG
ncbi:MAG: hypothetical protein P4M11_13535 [Candidatus Pacebacteria bacterium]|nr:hypothetical protein [Candidatus Paceibacterota bacterium]